ncbi:MAG: hypothetical protein Q8K40_00815 [Ignavibacteria bacterium]|nr:hypothetical protein [Ignavibacteria bacterium]
MEVNDIRFVPHLTDLISRIRQSVEDQAEAQRATEFALEQLPYSLSASGKAVIELADAQISAKDSMPDFLFKGGERSLKTYLLPDNIRNRMGYAVDNYFDSARRTQNAINLYIGKVLKLSLPHSLNDLVKRIEKRKCNMPDRISKMIMDYWNADGKRVKLYRDLAQHHAVISSDARLIITPDGHQLIYLVLPNNPEENRLEKLKYGDPRIDAFPYVFNSFSNLHKYVFGITHLLLSYTEEPSHGVISLILKNPLRMGGHAIEGHPMPSIPKIKETISTLSASLLMEYNSEMPRRDIIPTLLMFKK